MDSSSKQRLVGVVVLIALATIVLPIVFHHSSKTELALNIPQDAPPPPPLPDIQIAPASKLTPQTVLPSKPYAPEKSIPEKVATIITPETTPVIKPMETHVIETKPTVKLAPKKVVKISAPKKTTKQTWLVQIGSFKNKHNADKLVAKLRLHGFKAHSKTNTAHTPITKVTIGPEYKRASADWIVRKLSKTLHIKGIVVRTTT